MQILIVEDNAFNAFCLTRLLESTYTDVNVFVASDSHEAMKTLEVTDIHLMVLDGDLGAADGQHCNGVVLADLIWRKYPTLPIVAWTDSHTMRDAFAAVFQQHHKVLNRFSHWNKAVSPYQLEQTVTQLLKHDEQSQNLQPLPFLAANPGYPTHTVSIRA